MVATYLVPEQTVTANGQSQPVAVEPGQMEITLGISEAVEQESLDVSIWGSQDGTDWGKKPIAAFPQKFYAGLSTLVVDLSAVTQVQVRWQVNRWGRGPLTPSFTFFVAWEPL